MTTESAVTDLLDACADSNTQLSDAEARVSRVKLLRQHHARRAVALGAVAEAAAALHVTPDKLGQMARAHDLTNHRHCC